MLDPKELERVNEIEESEQNDTDFRDSSSWREFFAYPGPMSISRKVLTPLLLVLWLGMMATASILLLTTTGLTIVSLFQPDIPVTQIMIAQFPLLIVFLFCFLLYRFFHRFTATPME